MEGVCRASLGRPGGALNASGAWFPRPGSVKHHVFYDDFLRFHVLALVLTPMAAQAALVDNMERLGSNLWKVFGAPMGDSGAPETSWGRFGSVLAAFGCVVGRFSLPKKCPKPCDLRGFFVSRAHLPKKMTC